MEKNHCNDTGITDYNISDKHKSFTAYILLYKLIV